MDIGCTYPTSEHVSSFLSTCKQLGLTTIAFRGSVEQKSLVDIEERSKAEYGHTLRCLSRADLRLVAGPDAIANLAKKLTVSAVGSSSSAASAISYPLSSSAQALRDTRKEYAYEDCDLLVLHLDPDTDVSILGDNDFGKLILASQNEVIKRRGPGARLIVVNLDCFVANHQQPQKVNTISAASAKSFAMCKALSKSPEVVFELSYLPWIRAHAQGGARFQVPQHILERHDQQMDDFMSQPPPANKASAREMPPPPTQPLSMLQSLRAISQDIVSAYMKPLLLSSGQIKAVDMIPSAAASPTTTTSISSSASSTTISSDLLFMRAPRDVYALASVLTQLRRPLMEQGIAVLRRLTKFDEKAFANGINTSTVAACSTSRGSDNNAGTAKKRTREER